MRNRRSGERRSRARMYTPRALGRADPRLEHARRKSARTLTTIKVEKPELPVLILSMYPEDQYALPTLKGGASGYIVKADASDQLAPAIRKVVAGEVYLSPALREKLASA